MDTKEIEMLFRPYKQQSLELVQCQLLWKLESREITCGQTKEYSRISAPHNSKSLWWICWM